jgi:hypothetical protein
MAGFEFYAKPMEQAEVPLEDFAEQIPHRAGQRRQAWLPHVRQSKFLALGWLAH